jgi:glycosyltransferase involved in cell wall biosynthesis
MGNNTNAPMFSVVITTYNYGRFIEQAIESVLSQEYPRDKIEVIVADDGSTDDTAVRAKRYDSRVKYFYQPNKGQAAAINLGAANASGEIISLLDGDDFFLPGKLTRVSEAFQRDPHLGMVYHPMIGWNSLTNESRKSQYALTSGSLFKNPEKFLFYWGPGTCVSYRRQYLTRLLPIPAAIRMLADAYPGSLIIFLAPILALPECLSVYRLHESNSFQVEESRISREVRESRLRQWRIVVDCMKQWLASDGFTRNQWPVRYVTDGWEYYLNIEQFALTPPGRLRFFRSVLFENRMLRPLQTWRLNVFNYLYAPAALAFGYEGAERFRRSRAATMEALQTLLRRSSSHARA